MRPTWTSAGNLQTVLLGLASGGVYLAAVSPRRRRAPTAPLPPRPRALARAPGGVFLGHFPAGFPGSGSRPPCPVMSGLSTKGEPPRLLGLHAQPHDLDGGA